MKAVVTFELDEMPKNCGDCLLVMDFKATQCLVCMGINDTIPNNANDGIIGAYSSPEHLIELYERKPDWCPLKELPEPEINSSITDDDWECLPDDYEVSTAYAVGHQNGFNDCLKEITED